MLGTVTRLILGVSKPSLQFNANKETRNKKMYASVRSHLFKLQFVQTPSTDSLRLVKLLVNTIEKCTDDKWEILVNTRLHSSRMRTGHALTVSPSMLCSGGGGGCMVLGGGAWSWGTHGGCMVLGGAWSQGGMHCPGVCAWSQGWMIQGVHGPRGCMVLGDASFGGGWWYPSMHWGRPPLWTESHTRVKT